MEAQCPGSSGNGEKKPEKRNEENKPESTKFLEVQCPESYGYAVNKLETPRVMGTYFTDGETQLNGDSTKLPLLDRGYLPQRRTKRVNLNLWGSKERLQAYTGGREKTFAAFLKWILDNKSTVMAKTNPKFNIDIITMKGNLVWIMKTPYEPREWTMYALRFGGLTYLVAKDRNNQGDFRKIELFSHTYLHYMKGGQQGDAISANDEFRIVLQTTIDGISLAYSISADCADPQLLQEDFKDMNAFLFLKITSSRLGDHSSHKTLQWWSEMELSGIPLSLIGTYDRRGCLHTLDLYDRQDMPHLTRGSWQPEVSLNFLAKFLKLVREKLDAFPGSSLKFHRQEAGDIYCTVLTAEEEKGLLPSWYKDGL